MAAGQLARFHNYYDARVISTLRQKPARSGTVIVHKHRTIQDRTLRYLLTPHYHPYVPQLLERLVEKSVPGLQAIDTEYSTPAALSATVQVTLPDGTSATLAAGQTVQLADGALVNLPDPARLTADRFVRVADLSLATLAAGAPVTLPAKLSVRQADGRLVTLAAAVPALLPSGKPTPLLFEDVITRYGPSELVSAPYPVKNLDFTSNGAYSIYNWELFFHVPLTAAMHLSKNQRFEDAQHWFHYIFDPTDNSDGPTPERYWKVKPFQTTDVRMIQDILVNLATGDDPALQQDTAACIEAWKDAPFRPHVIARYRPSAYMFKTVMAYLDNLIAWGDSLFRQDTGEAINEATQLYVLAANILGPRPQPVPSKGSVRPQTYANLKKDLDAFGGVLKDVEASISFELLPHPTDAADNDRLSTVRSLGKALYFCVPRNDVLLRYWDTVADRLFKIRNSLNIQGIFRQLPLFEPPIDPGLLAKAVASGLDIAAVVAGVNQPVSPVRYQLLAQRASEICQEVKALGGALLSAIEKQDNEAIAVLRARHEGIVLSLAQSVKYSQLQEAIKSREGVERTLANAAERYTYYERQLNAKVGGDKEEDVIATVPTLEQIDANSLVNMKFKAQEPTIGLRKLVPDIAGDLGDAGGHIMSSQEAEELSKLSTAQTVQDAVGAAELVAKALALLPDFGLNIHFWGLGGNSPLIGGTKFSALNGFIAEAARAATDRLRYEAGNAGKVAGYARRELDWAFQSNVAAGEFVQALKQLRAAQIREAIAQLELSNHKEQMKHAQEIDQFLNGDEVAITDTEKHKKTTTRELYAWQRREVRGLYNDVFQFALDVARKAERALQHELGKPDASFIQTGYMAGKEGLLAGEKLYFDLKRMDAAYADLNQREYELTQHISLLQLNPLALLQLQMTGRCRFSVPEALFDMGCPGHYFRRIKSAAVSIPCITGPYTSVNCRLTLLRSSIRKVPILGDGYARMGADDDRFVDDFSSLQSIVTSSSSNDSGLFETNLRDERYLPFEMCGAISDWQLDLPSDVREFDYSTIADVILHLRYMARPGGGMLENGAIANLTDSIQQAQANGSVRLFSVRNEFPSEWAKFTNTTIDRAHPFADLALTFRPEHYPFWSRGRLEAIRRVEILARSSKATIAIAENADGTGAMDTLVKDKTLGDLRHGSLKNIPLPTPTGAFTIHLNDNTMDDLWLALSWGAMPQG
jgi:hypothetical protein